MLYLSCAFHSKLLYTNSMPTCANIQHLMISFFSFLLVDFSHSFAFIMLTFSINNLYRQSVENSWFYFSSQYFLGLNCLTRQWTNCFLLNLIGIKLFILFLWSLILCGFLTNVNKFFINSTTIETITDVRSGEQCWTFILLTFLWSLAQYSVPCKTIV